jgi:hypothetical protein
MKQIVLVCILVLTGVGVAVPAESNGGDLVRRECSTCHGLDRICAHQAFSRDMWVETVRRMREHGAALSNSQERSIIEFLATGGTPGWCADQGSVDHSHASTRVLFFGHPVFMVLAFLPVLYALGSGFRRFMGTLKGRKVVFAWRNHVRAGSAGLGMWLLGSLGGGAMTTILLGGIGITGLHYQVARIMIPLLVVGAGLGLYMDRSRKKRVVLPVVHGVNNVILVLLGGVQLVTGIVFLSRIMW